MFYRIIMSLLLLTPVNVLASSEIGLPLNKREFRNSINDFSESCFNGYCKLDIPEIVKLKKNLTFKLDDFRTEVRGQTSARISTLLIKEINPLVKSKNVNYIIESSPVIGKVVLVEHPQNKSPDGIFSLHFIEVNEAYQGKGYGGTSLDLTILLARHLALKSSFYKNLTLQCADEDNGKNLGNIPYRLSYYLNHGFQVDLLTMGYMKHLDIKYFLHWMSLDTFKRLYKDYQPVDAKIKFDADFQSILDSLKKEVNQYRYMEQDELLQIAESSSSDAAQSILDCLYYDSAILDEEQNNTGSYIYLMHLDVIEWEKSLKARQEILSSRQNPSPYSYEESIIQRVCDLIEFIYNQDYNDSDQENVVMDVMDKGRLAKQPKTKKLKIDPVLN